MTVVSDDEGVRHAATDSVTFAFGDSAAGLYGLARLGISRLPGGGRQGSALAVLFAGGEPVAALAQGGLEVAVGAGWSSLELTGLRATVAAPLERWSVAFDGAGGLGFALEFTALGGAVALASDAPAGRLGGMAGYDQPCRVRGTVRAGARARTIDALGQRGHAWGDPDWEKIGLARTVTAWTADGSATFTSIRPFGAHHHAAEATWAALWERGPKPGGPAEHAGVEITDGRLSTTYDADGHPRRAGLELWPEGDDQWARRAAGEVVCGSSFDLGALALDCAFFRWHLEGREGVGRYDILRRATVQAASAAA